MCEFTVSLKGRSEGKVAEGVVSLRYVDGVLELADIIGKTYKVENAVVTSIDVKTETMALTEVPLIAELLRFAEKYLEVVKTGRYDKSVEDAWNELKTKGELLLRQLWSRYERRQ